MPDKIRFSCKVCGQNVGVHPTRVGMVGKCPKCGKPLVVPADSLRPPTGVAPTPAAPKRAAPPRVAPPGPALPPPLSPPARTTRPPPRPAPAPPTERAPGVRSPGRRTGRGAGDPGRSARPRAAGPSGGKSKTTAALLALFLGGFGAHHFYLGATVAGLVQIGISAMTLGLGGVLAFIEAILLFRMDAEDFDAKYVARRPVTCEFVFLRPDDRGRGDALARLALYLSWTGPPALVLGALSLCAHRTAGSRPEPPWMPGVAMGIASVLAIGCSVSPFVLFRRYAGERKERDIDLQRQAIEEDERRSRKEREFLSGSGGETPSADPARDRELQRAREIRNRFHVDYERARGLHDEARAIDRKAEDLEIRGEADTPAHSMVKAEASMKHLEMAKALGEWLDKVRRAMDQAGISPDLREEAISEVTRSFDDGGW